MFFTAGRTTYSASADSTFKFNDTIKVYGQPLCRIADTLSGTIVKNRYDTTNTQLLSIGKLLVTLVLFTTEELPSSNKFLGMFTGIIEQVGQIKAIETKGTNVDFWLESTFQNELKIDQSVAHNGVCLTVVELKENLHRVTAVAETISKTNLASWQVGSIINLERAMKMGDRLDGHFVQGHVDTVGRCVQKKTLEGSWLFQFEFP